MAAAMGPQFEFEITHSIGKGKTQVSAYDGWGSPVGAAEITHGDHHGQVMQRSINESAARGATYPTHTVGEAGQDRIPEYDRANAGEIPGQRHWKGGNFTPAGPDYISWLHAAKPAALKPMLGMAVAERGKVPVADSQLSDDGSRFSRSMRKYGIQGHPSNPDMESTIGRMGDRHVWDLTNHVMDQQAGNVNTRSAMPGEVARGIQTANAIRDRSRPPKVSSQQFEQLSFDLAPDAEEAGWQHNQMHGQQRWKM